MEQIEQEHACYRMFGWLVDDTFPDCFHLFDPNAQPDEGRKEF